MSPRASSRRCGRMPIRLSKVDSYCDIYGSRASFVQRQTTPKAVAMTISPLVARPVPLPDADSAVAAILAVHELRYPGEAHHADRVARVALELTAMIRPGLAATDGIGHAYLLHDVGNLGIPDEILVKPDVLTPVELRVVQTHTTLGEELVRRLRFLSPLVRDVVACHHERWDGHGYPRQIAADQIPLAARILAVVDAYDAMTHDRPYRDALPTNWALAELKRCAGTQFDPVIVEAFLQLQQAASTPAAS